MTAIEASRNSRTVLLLERSGMVGGLPANGLGATDIATRGVTTGLFTEFVGNIKDYYIRTYGAGSRQVKDCSDGYHFEPKVASMVFQKMIDAEGSRIKVLTMRQFDSDPAGLTVVDGRIRSIRILNRMTGETETYSAEVFVDATYEGDLGAAAGVPFRVGREGRAEFGENGAGRVFKYWEGAEDSGSAARRPFEMPFGEGSTLVGDNAVQAYNYRLCLTDNPSNRIPFPKPENYDRSEFVSLVDDVLDGRNTNFSMASVTPEDMARNREVILNGGKTTIPGDRWGIAKIVNMVRLPNGKTDANNQHLALISTDLPEENWGWPTGSWEWRDRFCRRLKDYTLGLLWFASHDEALPKQFRKAVSEWGFAADEYEDNGGFPRQVYVREGRRFEGRYFFTASDATPVSIGSRPPLHGTSIAASHYALDSHGVRKREPGKIHLDGFLSFKSAPYTIPVGVMLPREVDNLILPVPVSGSHIGFSTLRMEPCWMALGQAAGELASIAVEKGLGTSAVPVSDLQDRLVSKGVTIIYYRDVDPENPDFAMVQYLGVRGFLPGWEADLDSAVSPADLSAWQSLAGFAVDGEGRSRREILREIYSSLTAR